MSDLTLEEQEKILLVAEGLIHEEANWRRGTWKCAARTYDKTTGKMVPRCDINGKRLYEYCIEGAVNQAARNVLPPDRLVELHFATQGPGKRFRFAWNQRYITDVLDINRTSRKLYGMGAMNYNDGDESTHEGVLKILKTRLKEVRSSLRSKK